MSRDVLWDREEMVFSVSICPGILRYKTLDLGLKKQRELPGYPRFPTQKRRSTGYLYLKGKGVEKDMTESRKWLEKAAAQGDSYAQELLADFFPDSEK